MSQIKKLQQGGTTLKFGSDKVVDANQFYDKIAADVEDYISKQNWSKKEKDRFRNAYKDIMSRGVTGMQVIDGIRNTTYNGDQIDNESLARKLRDAYGEASYYINQKMEEVAYNPEEKAKADKEAEEQKEKERVASLPKFNTGDFDKFFIKTVFGGQENPNIQDWDDLDTVDSTTHYRSTKNRIAALDKVLEKYIEQLPEQNYEGSAFRNLDEYKEKLEAARNALKFGNLQEIKQTLNAAGINWKHFLETDTLTPEGRQQFEQQKQAAAQQAAQQAATAKQEKQKDDKKTKQDSGIEVQEPILEQKNLPGGETALKDIGKLIEENPEYFWGSISALAADVVSIVDPEPISAAVLGVGAAGARHYANAHTKEGAGFWSTVGDYGLGLLGAVPIVGDYALSARAVKTLKGIFSFLGKGAITMFTIYGGAAGARIASKITKGEDLTFEDFKDLGNILIGMKGLKGLKSGKAVEALNAARKVKIKGNVKFKVKDSSGNIKEISVDLKEGPDAEIWKKLKTKSHAEQRRILSENKAVQEALKREGIITNATKAEAEGVIQVGKDNLFSKLENNSVVGNLGRGKADAVVTRGETVYTGKPLTQKEVDAIADANRGWLSPTEFNRRVYRNIYAELEGGRPVGFGRGLGRVFRRERILGKNAPYGARRFELDNPLVISTKTHSWAANNLNAPGKYMVFGKNGSNRVTLNADGTFTVSNSLSKSGQTDYIIDNQADLDRLLNTFGKVDKVIISGGKPKVVKQGKYRTQAEKDEAFKKLFEDFGIYRYGGRINNLDNYLTNFILNNN